MIDLFIHRIPIFRGILPHPVGDEDTNDDDQCQPCQNIPTDFTNSLNKFFIEEIFSAKY